MGNEFHFLLCRKYQIAIVAMVSVHNQEMNAKILHVKHPESKKT